PSGPWSATSGLAPISSFSRSPMARTMGSDMLTTPAPSGRRMQLKCSDWRYSCSRMNPRSGLAHPSASTCAHSTSTAARRTRGSASASPRSAARRSGAATRSTSAPPSGSMRELRTVTDMARRPWRRARRGGGRRGGAGGRARRRRGGARAGRRGGGEGWGWGGGGGWWWPWVGARKVFDRRDEWRGVAWARGVWIIVFVY
ncbi:hypothetical protein EE612_021926, partial [Oryza sativa]